MMLRTATGFGTVSADAVNTSNRAIGVPYLQADSTGPTGKMEDVTKLLEKLSQDMNEVKTQNKHLVQELKTKNIKLAGKIQSVERRLKKYNLVIYGLKEGDTDLYEEVLSLLLTKLDLDVKEMEIRDVFRLGRSTLQINAPL
ncbi:hypothetical protein JTB14_032598 [Gonioctena quinquepunctata]|nr:hypothetical protein JTB14_032598 [Gonioctena quinquepunctata]